MQIQKYLQSQYQFSQNPCSYCEQTSHIPTIPTKPIHIYQQCNHYNITSVAAIDQMINSYHNPILIRLQDQYGYFQEDEFLKRMYFGNEYNNKIIMLSQYYKYHNEVPRIFMESITQTIENYVEQRREFQHKKLQNILGGKNEFREARQKKNENNRLEQKLLKSIQLSYQDFQNKQIKHEQKNKKRNHNFGKNSHNINHNKIIKNQFLNKLQSTKKYSITSIFKQKNKKLSKPKSNKGLSKQKSQTFIPTLQKLLKNQQQKNQNKKTFRARNSSHQQQIQKQLHKPNILSKQSKSRTGIPLKTIDLNNNNANVASKKSIIPVSVMIGNNNLQDMSKIQKKYDESIIIKSNKKSNQKLHILGQNNNNKLYHSNKEGKTLSNNLVSSKSNKNMMVLNYLRRQRKGL